MCFITFLAVEKEAVQEKRVGSPDRKHVFPDPVAKPPLREFTDHTPRVQGNNCCCYTDIDIECCGGLSYLEGKII